MTEGVGMLGWAALRVDEAISCLEDFFVTFLYKKSNQKNRPKKCSAFLDWLPGKYRLQIFRCVLMEGIWGCLFLSLFAARNF